MDNSIITELNEQRVDELLAYTPDYSEHNAENIRKLFMQKTTRKHKAGRRLLLAAAIVAVAVALSGIALAATGFDLGKIYNSFFNNPSTVNKIEVGQSITNNGIEVTLLSAFTDGGRAHALLELKDLQGNRLSDSIKLLSSSRGYDVYTGAAMYNEAENKATLALTMYIHDPVSLGDILNLNIDTILSGIDYIDSEPLDFDIAVLAVDRNTISIDEWNDFASGGVKMPGTMGQTGDDDLSNIQLLRIGGMEASIPGIDWAVITNIGLVDGRVHIQYKRTEAYNSDYNIGYFSLLDNSGTAISDFFSIRMAEYSEMAFNIGGLDLADLKLAVSGNRVDNVVLGPWNMSFVVDQETPKVSITAEPADSPYFSRIEVTCSPIATSIRLEMNEQADNETYYFEDVEYLNNISRYFASYGLPYLTLDDGTIVNFEIYGLSFDITGGCGDYESAYFDVERLYSITICGEEYVFSRD